MTLEQVLRNTAIAALFCVPFIVLIISSSLFFPYITGKNFAFRFLIEIAGAAWLALAFINANYRPRFSWILLSFTAFVLVIGLADVFGVNPFKSIWSNYERMDGWITLAHLFVFFAAASSIFDDALWKRWWQTTLGVSVLAGLHGLMQLIGVASISTQSGSRVDGTFGNATYLGVYMLFHIFIAALLLAGEWNSRPKNKRMDVAVVYGGIIGLNSLILFFTATRGAILGLIGGAVLAAALFLFRAGNAKVIRYVVGALGLIFLVSFFVWTQRDAVWVQRIEPLHRLATMSFTERTIISRFMNAGMAWEGFKERPIFGWGQENYAVVFDKYYNPEMYGQEPWFDRVHNVVFDWLIAGGILGLLAYLSLYATALYALWRSSVFTHVERSLITGLMVGYFGYLLFTFDNIMSYVMFTALLAYIAARSSLKASNVFADIKLPRASFPVVVGAVVLAVGGVSWFANADALAQNRALIRGLSPQPNPEQNLAYFKDALSYVSVGTQEAREHLSQTAMGLSQNGNAPQPLRQQFYDLASSEMKKQMEDSPLNARFPLFLGILHDSYGNHAAAAEALQKAHELSPRKQSIIFQLGINAIARGNIPEALQQFKAAYDLAPENPEARSLYAAALITAGQVDAANDIVRDITSQGTMPDQRILASYVSQNRYDKIAEFLGIYLQKKPDDIQARLTHAAALYASGNVSASVEELKEVQRRAPNSAAAAASLIQQAQAGTWQVR